MWLFSAGSAWAGSAGDVGTAQTEVAELCSFLNINPCPQLPTLTQLILEIAGLENTSPDIARFAESVSPTAAINTVNPPAGLPFNPINVAPLAFVSPVTTGGVATVTETGDPAANSFFYAATDGASGTAPTNLYLTYDYPPLTTSSFAKNQFVANLSLPLVMRNSDNSETAAPTTIRIVGATGCGKTTPCVSATATGSFGTVSAASLGLNVTLVFGPSPNSSTLHAIFQVRAPLLVTKTNDPAYFTTNPAYGPNGQFFYPGLTTSFFNDVLGFTPKFLGLPIGVAPYAAPQCPNGPNGQPMSNCATASPPPSSNFPFCASIAVNGVTRPAAAAFYSIGTVGTTYLSMPLVAPNGVTCPF